MLHRCIPLRSGVSHAACGGELAPAIMAVGTPEFAQSLLGAVNDLAQACLLTIVEFSPARAPYTFLVSTQRARELTDRLGRQYFEGYYQEDPNYSVMSDLIGKHGVTLVRRERTEFNQPYWERFYKGLGIADKLTVLCNAGTTIAASVYKSEEHGLFTDQEIDNIARVTPLLSATTTRHCQLLSSSQVDLPTVVARIATAQGVVFTSREGQVCAGILRGQSSQAIGLTLGIAISSVHTYRKSLYRKLNIVSQAELFARAFRAVAGSRPQFP